MLMRLRTAWSCAHRDSSSAALTELLSRDESSRALFVGMMTSSVNGTTDTRSKPPTSHQAVPPVSHAMTANTKPAIANDACMTAARRELGENSVAAISIPHAIVAGCSTRVMYRAAPANTLQAKVVTNSAAGWRYSIGDSLSLFVSSHNREWPVRRRGAVASLLFSAWCPGRYGSRSWSRLVVPP